MSDIRKLEKIQEHLLRLVYGGFKSSYSEVLDKSGYALFVWQSFEATHATSLRVFIEPFHNKLYKAPSEAQKVHTIPEVYCNYNFLALTLSNMVATVLGTNVRKSGILPVALMCKIKHSFIKALCM